MSIHYNPSVTASPCHLPLHKGGFGAYNHFTNYDAIICKRQEIIPLALLFNEILIQCIKNFVGDLGEKIKQRITANKY